jgi:hypothetical protein
MNVQSSKTATTQDALLTKPVSIFGRSLRGPGKRISSSLMPENPQPDSPVFFGGGSRPNTQFRELCTLAGIKPKTNFETGEEEPWVLKDLRNSCATYYDEHVPESSIEILGHS